MEDETQAVRDKAEDVQYMHLDPFIAVHQWWPPGPDRAPGGGGGGGD